MPNLVDSRAVRTPYFEIWMAGQMWSPLLHSLVQQVQYVEASTEASTCKITIQDPDYILLDDPNLVRSTAMQIYGGFVNDNRLWLEGYISMVDFNFPQSGPPTVEITVMDESYIMDTLPRYQMYKDMYSDEIAAQIARNYGFKFVGDRGPRQYKRKIQSKETDIKFLQSMANDEWFVIKILNGTMYWKQRSFSGKPIGTVWYRRPPFDVLSFAPTLVQADRLDGYVQNSINPATGQTTTSAVSNYNPPPEAGLVGDIPTSANQGGGGDSYVQYDPTTGQWNTVSSNSGSSHGSTITGGGTNIPTGG